MAEFSNKHAPCKAIEENTNTWVFVPSGGARHRPVKTKTGIERIFLCKNMIKKAVVNVNKNMHAGLGRQLKET